MYFKVSRNLYSKFARKVSIELYSADDKLLDTTLMFGYALTLGAFKRRLKRRQARMLRFQKAMQAASGPVI